MPRTAGATSSASLRRATNVTLPEALLREARALDINLSQACERGLVAEVAATRRRRWIEENRAAMEAWNEHVATKGLPLPADRPV
jgi:antitoxin CcdA